MSIDALRWLVLLLNLCLAALVSLCSYIFFFVPPSAAPSVPNMDLTFIQLELARKDVTDTEASMAKYTVIVNTLEPPPPPGPTPEEIAAKKATDEEAQKAGGVGADGKPTGPPKPSGPLQNYVQANFEVELVVIDPTLKRSTAFLRMKKDRLTEVFPVGKEIEGERPVRIKAINEVGEGDTRYFEVVFTDDSAQDAILEYKPEEEGGS